MKTSKDVLFRAGKFLPVPLNLFEAAEAARQHCNLVDFLLLFHLVESIHSNILLN